MRASWSDWLLILGTVALASGAAGLLAALAIALS